MSGGNKGNALQVKLRGDVLSHPVYSDGTNVAAIQRGSMVNINAGGFAIQASDTANEIFAGISEEAVAAQLSTQAAAPNIRVRRRGIFKMTLDATSKATAPTLVGDLVYVNTAQGVAGGNDELVGLSTQCSTGYVLVGKIVKHGTDAQAKAATVNVADVWVDIMGVAQSVLGDALYPTLANLLAAEAAKGAHLVGTEDSDTYLAAVTVEDALAELRNRVGTTMSATGAQAITKAMQHMGVILVPNTAALTLTMATPVSGDKGLTVTVVKTTADAEIITIATASSETIDGAATYTALDAQYDTATFIWDGAGWNVSDFGEIYAKLALFTAGNGAELIGVEDSKGYGTSKTVQDALEAIVAKGHIDIPLGSFTAGDGAALTLQTSTEPGYQVLSSKELVLDYPDDGGATDLMFGGIAMPQDFDESAGFTVHFLAEKSGNNNADLTFDLTAYMAAVGDSNNADANDTAAITMTNTATTIEELVFTCGAGAGVVLAPPCSLSGIISIVTAGTDHVNIHAAWIEYTRDIQ